jgi:adenine C2-methylase RlmN of 23S rRNA A2503 and tRNA A37
MVFLYSSSGTMGLKGDLTCGEIIEQLLHARSISNIRNVVFMVRNSSPLFEVLV